jgi:hypothetical protein
VRECGWKVREKVVRLGKKEEEAGGPEEGGFKRIK